jgi:hypothetical protein
MFFLPIWAADMIIKFHSLLKTSGPLFIGHPFKSFIKIYTINFNTQAYFSIPYSAL